FILMLVGCFEAFYGLVEYLSRHQHIFLFKKKYYTDCVTGTYINRNHFAGYLEMVIPLTLGYFLSQRSPVINRKSKSWRYHLSTVDTRLSINSLLIFAVIIMILALIFSQSRMGILSLLSSMGFMALMLISSSKRKGRRILSFIFTVTLILIFWGAWIGLDPVMKRFSVVSQNWTSESGRLAVWKDTVNLIKDFPILGTGLGTYEHIFPKYKTFTSRNVYKHAHNDYMEFLSEAGLIGFIIIFGGVGFYMIKIIGKWRERRDPFVKGITLGGLSALVSLLFHSITDFNLHIPANAMLLAVIMGLTFSSVNLRRSEA
ncbi:MAG: O-antigen ligase family protein, partial [Thermodesulfobacteriota bacterium]|nr:O-antigen ligase family protein [Thermodesulfobacteriota bacterium]